MSQTAERIICPKCGNRVALRIKRWGPEAKRNPSAETIECVKCGLGMPGRQAAKA